MWSSSSARIVRLVMAPILSLWVAGAGCMLGCENMIAAAAHGGLVDASEEAGHHGTLVVSGDACTSSKSHDCCKKKAGPVVKKTHGPEAQDNGATLVSSSDRSSETMKECPLAVGRTIVIAKKRAVEAKASPTVAHSVVPPPNVVEQNFPLSYAPRLPNRGHTYLHCCVFLI
jgi:hypothetical protein